jgi:TolA-binding protein
MSSWACKLIGIWLLLAVGKGMLHAASDAEIADYTSASQAFNDRFWDRADRELTAFLENYPESEFRAEAVLFQAESRIKLGNLGSAIGLLESGRGTAGRFADEYQFWLAEARLQSGQLSAAADSYALFVSTYTNSPRLLDAIVGEAAARSQLKQWPRVAELLADPDGRFQQLANANPILAAVVRGRFLLAEAQLAQGKYEAAQQAIQPLVSQPLEPQLAWQRDFLKARILRQQGLLEEALALTNNLATFSAGFPNLKAEENAFQAGVLEQSERKEEAISAWRLNLVPAIPPERQREALLHLGDLLIGEGRLAEASQTIETFLGAGTNAATADIALLTLGELRLRLSRETNAPVSTNLLSTALESFDYVLSNYPSGVFG